MKARLGLVLLMAITMVLSAAPLRAAEDPVGSWIGTTEVPDQGTDRVVLTITKSDGGYAGTMTDSLGQVAQEPLRDIRVADGVLTFGFSLTNGTAMTMKLTMSGDKMAGEWVHPEGGVGAIAFERKKA